MSYIMLEGLVCVVVAAGMATLVLASSLVVMLAYQELQTPFEAKAGPPQTGRLRSISLGRNLEVSPNLCDEVDQCKKQGARAGHTRKKRFVSP